MTKFECSNVQIMATIKYLLQSKSTNAPIYLRLSNGVNQVYKRKTGLSINPKDWSKKGNPIERTGELSNLKTELNRLATKVYSSINIAESNGTTINGKWLQHIIDIHFERVNENRVSELITDAIQDVINTSSIRKNAKGGTGLSKSRINAYKSLKRIFSEYQKNADYKVKEVNIKFASEFLNYLTDVKKYDKGYALKKIADLKTVCYDAESNGVKVHPQLKKINSTKQNNEYVIYLNPAEQQQIEDTLITNESLINARKWLLIGCQIGQRGNDLLNLSESNFVIRNGYELIELQQQKGNKLVTIPVLEKTKELLKTGFPYRISLQKFNKHIKKVCKLAGLDELTEGKCFNSDTQRKELGKYPKYELIGSHVCRRSYATNFYTKIPTPLIMQITSHKLEKTFLNYIGKSSMDYAQQIADFYTLQGQKAKKETNLTIVSKTGN